MAVKTKRYTVARDVKLKIDVSLAPLPDEKPETAMVTEFSLI